MSNFIVIEQSDGTSIIEVGPAMTVTPEFNNYLQQVIEAVDDAETAAENAADSVLAATSANAQAAAASATQASGHKDSAAASAVAADNSANIAASFVGGNWPLPHSHVTGPVAVDPEYSRLSDAYGRLGKRYEYGQRIWDSTYGTEVWEGTTNLLPAGAENFVTGWTNGPGETCTVTDYPINIPDIGNVIAKRITGNGTGSSVTKRTLVLTGLSNPHTVTASLWAMTLSGNALTWMSGTGYNNISSSFTKISFTETNRATNNTGFSIGTNAITDILDIVVYAPQIEAKPYATPYTPPGTTRAAATLSIPVGATQKNLLTLNQATGGDTLGDTTGFSSYDATTATITRDTTEAWNGTGSIKVVTNNATSIEGIIINGVNTITGGKICVCSVYAKGEGTVILQVWDPSNGTRKSSTFTLTSAWQRLSFQFAQGATAIPTTYVITQTQQSATFYIDGLQLEEGTTASDFTLPAVDYTNALIDPSQPFSIEFDAVPWVDDKSATTRLFSLYGKSTNYVALMSAITTGNYYITYRSGSGSARSINSTIPVVVGTKKNFKINVSGSTVTFTIDGVDLTPVTFDGGFVLPVDSICRLGSEYTGAFHRNCSITNVRIRKGVALSTAERAYTGQLVADQYTTFASNLKETISSRPFVKVNGLAQNVVLSGDSPNQNAIFNGDFRLASRGTSFTDPASLSYTLDGWYPYYNGTGAFTISQQEFPRGQQEVPGARNFLRFDKTVAGSGDTFRRLYTKIEGVDTLNGQKAVLNVWLRTPTPFVSSGISIQQFFGTGGSTDVSLSITNRIEIGTKWKKYSFPVNLASIAGKTVGTGNHLTVLLLLPLNSAFQLDIADIELKPADAPDSYYRRDIQMLQQLGARTLQKLPANLQLRAVNVQANTIDFESVMLPVEMRGVPALSGTYSSPTNWKVLDLSGNTISGFTLATLNASANQIAFRATKTSHGLTDATLQLVTNILLSAEI